MFFVQGLAALIGFAFLLASGRALAASSSLKMPGGGQVLVDAKFASRDYDQGTLELRGDVKIIYNHNYLSCDQALINEKSHMIEAVGNVIMSSTQAYVEGSSAVLSYSDNTGIIQDGFVKSGQVIFEGSVVKKTGPLTYEAEKSYYTACTTCPAAWTFEGTRMKAEIGGYALIKYPIMKIAGFPVFWLPYLLIPLKSERQSGFLIPTFEFYQGFTLGLVYFWAIDRSQDATITLKSYSQRGEKGLVNYRYVLDESSGGELNTGLIHDQIFPSETDNPVGNRSTRWFLNFSNVYELPMNISERTNLNMASDLFYPRDFWTEMAGQADPALENKVSLTKNTFGTHTSIEADYYINMLKSNPIDSNSDAVNRWPEIRFSAVDHPIFDSHLLFSFDLDYVNFARDDYAYDNVIQAQAGAVTNGNNQSAPYGYPKQIDTSRNGTAQAPATAPAAPGTPQTAGPTTPYNTGYAGGNFGGTFNPANDIMRTGQRLDLSPQLSYPIAAGKYVDILPSLQYRRTQYAFNVSPPTTLPDGSPAVQYASTPYQEYVYAQTSLRTRFYRIFGNQNESPKRSDPPAPATNWVDSESSPADLTQVLKPADYPDLYRHEVIPELVASYIPYVAIPSNNPFFNSGTQQPLFLQSVPLSNDDFYEIQHVPANQIPTTPATGVAATASNIQFDYNDRIAARTALTGLITNRLVRKRWKDGQPTYIQIASWKLGEAYDFTEQSRVDDPKLPWSDVTSVLDLTLDRFAMSSTVQYYPYHHVANTISSIRYKTTEAGTNYIQLDYQQIWNITRYVEQTTRNDDYLGLSSGFKTKYVDMIAGLGFTPNSLLPVSLNLTNWSTDLRIRPPGNCWVFKIQYTQAFAGPVVTQFELEYNFGGA